MSFGYSFGDLVSLAKLSYDIHSFCRAAPAELEGLSCRLESISGKLERLSAVLKRSGLGTWNAVPRLEQHLIDARSCLDPLRSGVGDTLSVPSKAKGLVRLAFSQEKLRQVEKNLDADERAIDEMRMDIVIESSLRNMQQMQDLQSHLTENRPLTKPTEPMNYLLDDTLRGSAPVYTRADRVDAIREKSTMVSRTISKASSALEAAAKLTRRSTQTEYAASTDSVALDKRSGNTLMAAKFLTEVVSIAEETELYANDTLPEYKLEKLSKRITGVWPAPLAIGEAPADLDAPFKRDSQPTIDLQKVKPSRYSDVSMLLPEPPPSVSELMCDPVSQALAERQSEDRYLSLKEVVTPPTDRCLSSKEVVTESAEHVAKLLDEKLMHYDNPLLHIGRASASLGNSLNPSAYCSFDMKVCEGLVLLMINFSDKPRAFSDGCIPTLGTLTTLNPPHHRSHSISYIPSSPQPRTFQHCFPLQRRPIPHLLHPDVEGLEMEPDAPYTISFTERQSIYEEGAREGQQQRTAPLKYILYEKQDQATLCTTLFGKTLIATVGTNKITYSGREVSHMSAVLLWLDELSRTYSVTFYPNLLGKKSTPTDVEIKVLNLCEKKKQPRNANAIAVLADVMPRMNRYPDLVKAFSGISKCIIEFTRRDDQVLFSKSFKTGYC